MKWMKLYSYSRHYIFCVIIDIIHCGCMFYISRKCNEISHRDRAQISINYHNAAYNDFCYIQTSKFCEDKFSTVFLNNVLNPFQEFPMSLFESDKTPEKV